MMLRLVKMIMKMFPAHPQPGPTLREVFNLDEFKLATDTKKKQIMQQLAQDKYCYEVGYPFHLRFNMSLEEMRNEVSGKDILEIGCYVGGGARYFLEEYKINKYYGIDIDDAFIETAEYYNRERLGNMTFKKLFAENLDLPDGNFDAIFCFGVLEHVYDPRRVLQESWRVLKPGGKLFIVFPSFYSPWGNHLTMVTWAPWLQLVFADATIRKAYMEIIEERGENAYWYKPGNSMEMDRKRFYEVNGITFADFKSYVRSINFDIERWIINPILISGRVTVPKFIKYLISLPLIFLARVPIFEEVFQNYVIAVLVKPKQ